MLRVGNQKRPYGLDHLNSSNFMTFLERPLIVDAINRGNRRLGLASYGGTPDLAWNWQTGVFNMVQIQNTNDIVGDNAQMEFAGRLANTAWYDDSSNGRGYAHFGLAGTLAFPDGSSSKNQSQFRSAPEAQTALPPCSCLFPTSPSTWPLQCVCWSASLSRCCLPLRAPRKCVGSGSATTVRTPASHVPPDRRWQTLASTSATN